MNDRVKSNEQKDRERQSATSEDEDRYAIDPRTGFEYVRRRPGERIPSVPDNASRVSEPRLMYGCDVAA